MSAPLAATVADLAAAYDAMQGGDPRCAAQGDWPVEPVLPALARWDGAIRVARAGGYFAGPADEDVVEAVDMAARILDARRVVEIPEAARARAAAFVLTATEAGALHRDDLATRPFEYDPLIRDRLFAGALAPAAWAIAAGRFRRWFAGALDALFDHADVILAPATPCAAPEVGAEEIQLAGRTTPARLALGLFVQPLTLAGVPIATVPRLGTGGLPVGVQLISRAGREDLAIRAAGLLEEAGFSAGLTLRSPSAAARSAACA